MTEQTTALARSIAGQDFAIMALDRPIAEIVREALGPENVGLSDLEQLRIPAGGGTTWEFSDVPVKEFVGVIVGNKMGRAFWKEEYVGGSTPPDCRSDDCIRGIGNPGGDCTTYREGQAIPADACPYAQWGSDAKGGKGQACKCGRLLLIVTPGSILPAVLRIPPTSLSEIRHYLSRVVVAKGKKTYEVATKFSLVKVSGNGVPDYSKVVVTFAGNLTPEQSAFFGQVTETFRPILATAKAEEAVDRDSNEPAPSEANQ